MATPPSRFQVVGPLTDERIAQCVEHQGNHDCRAHPGRRQTDYLIEKRHQRRAQRHARDPVWHCSESLEKLDAPLYP